MTELFSPSTTDLAGQVLPVNAAEPRDAENLLHTLVSQVCVPLGQLPKS